MQSIPKNLQDVAIAMIGDLIRQRISVELAPNHDPAKAERGLKIRVVTEHNPAWYQAFCAEYPKRRTRPRRRKKPDTCIDHTNTLRALEEIASGRAKTLYAQRLLPHVQAQADFYEQLFTAADGHGRAEVSEPHCPIQATS